MKAHSRFSIARTRKIAMSVTAFIMLCASGTLIAVPSAAADTTQPEGQAIPNSQYTLVDFDSQSDPYPAPPSLDGTAAGAFDGDYTTQWASDYKNGAKMPHYLTFAIGDESQTLTGLGYSVKNQATGGQAKDVQIFTTTDENVANNWQSEQWVKAAEATFNMPKENTDIQYVKFDKPVQARWVQFKVLSALNGTDNVSASELIVFSTDTSTSPVEPEPSDSLSTIPSVADWQSTDGTYEYTQESRILTDGESKESAKLLAEGIADRTGVAPEVVEADSSSAKGGDITLGVDATRANELSDEGYEFTSSDTISIVGATDTGVFYGTQTLIQLLTNSSTIPNGSTIDVPEFSERGVGICACQIQISLPWFERLMKDMAYNKLNQLWIETKVESTAYSEANFWAYYTKDEAKQLQAWANEYHIELIPEVNSPGHMKPWLWNYPELQLTNSAGVKQPDRLDITKPEALKFITDLSDEYAEVFDEPYWHMGADEYMLGSAFDSYPQFTEYMQDHPDEYDSDAVPEDIYVDFLNKVAAYQRSKGRTLRVWNDGIPKNATHTLDKDVVVEFWDGREAMVQAKDIIEQGYDLENASYSLYLIRRNGSNPINEEDLWNQGWNPRKFDNDRGSLGDEIQDVAGAGSVRGAKISAWPDSATVQTENSVEKDLFMATRFIAQTTWSSIDTDVTYAQFKTLADALGHAPNYDNVDYHPLPDGEYLLSADGKTIAASDGLLVAGSSKFDFAATDDGYYTITTKSGSCLAMSGGTTWLGAPLDHGLAVSFNQSNCSFGNLAKWQILATAGGYEIENAITLMPLTLESDTVVQQPADLVAPAVFTIAKTTPEPEPVEGASDTLVARRGNRFYFKYSLSGGDADRVVAYGRPGDQVLVGDWDGDGRDTLAVRRGNTYYIKDSLSGGKAEMVVAYGRPGDQVLAGDWDGDGRDTLAVRRGNAYHIKDSLSGGGADRVIAYGRLGDQVLAGDWDGDGVDTLAVRRGRVYHLKNSLSGGIADQVVAYGGPYDQVFAGKWR